MIYLLLLALLPVIIALYLEAAYPKYSGWLKALAYLPVAWFIQMFLISPVGWQEGAAMCNCAMLFDVFVVARSLVGFLWQRNSADWRIYCALEFGIIPIIYIVAGWAEWAAHRHM